jgi:signal transduction histidine kinase
MNDDIPAHIAEKIQHALPSGLLHDLRTPLGHVLGYAELLQESAEEAGYKELLPYIQKIHTAGEQLLALMEQNFKSTPKTD